MGWEFRKGSAGQLRASHRVAVRSGLEGDCRRKGPFRAVSPRWLTWASLHHGCHPRYTVAEDFESKDSSKPSGSCVASDSVVLEATPGPFCPALLVEPATKVRLVYGEEA